MEQAASAAPRRLQGRVALVTGGGSGIGRAAALAYGREGAIVVVAGRRAAAIEETAALILAAGGTASSCVADVSQGGSVQHLVDDVLARHGRLDIAFNNAGVEGRFAPIGELEEADFDAVVATNLKGAWLCIKHQVAAMRAGGQGGAIVNTSSWLASRPVAGASAYAASKAGIDAMMRSVALEAGPEGIRINNVYPGIIDTPMFHRLGDAQALARFAAVTPLGRAGQPADVGDVALWLSSDEARFVTGQSVMVDGGFTLASA
jgi:NAD(P)-dependent dehydrogenase (short-subunit alcohol dehydrogenase family)